MTKLSTAKPGKRRKKRLSPRKTAVGWREWVALPTLGIRAIKAKFDTGARTSSLHAFDVETYLVDGEEWVEFTVRPLQRNSVVRHHCLAKVIDRRWVTNPGGRRQKRIVIASDVRIGDDDWPIEINLTDRDEMGFRLLIGRTAMHGRLVVDPGTSYRLGRPKSRRHKARRPARPLGHLRLVAS